MRDKTFRTLLKLSEIKLARDMAEMGQIRARYQARANERNALRARAVTEFDDAQTGPATLAAYATWSDWSHQRRQLLDLQDSDDTGALEGARKVLSRSFGETRALGLLLEQETVKNRKIRVQRAERSGLPPED